MGINLIQCPEEYTGYTGPADNIMVFLAGGITDCPLWQDEIVEKFNGSDLFLANPRRKEWPENHPDPTAFEREQVTWEYNHLLRSNGILFWFPKETVCPITLFELGSWANRPKKLFIGIEPGYSKEGTVRVQIDLERVGQKIHNNLDDLVDDVLFWEGTLRKDPFSRSPEQPEPQSEKWRYQSWQ